MQKDLDKSLISCHKVSIRLSHMVVQEPVATTKLESEKTEQSAPRDKNTAKVSIQDQPTISDGSSEPQEREQLRPENKTNKHLPLLCQLLGVEINEPFCFVNAAYFSNCVYRVNDNGLREVRVGDDFWLPCQNEGELVYLLQHHQNIKVVER